MKLQKLYNASDNHVKNKYQFHTNNEKATKNRVDKCNGKGKNFKEHELYNSITNTLQIASTLMIIGWVILIIAYFVSLISATLISIVWGVCFLLIFTANSLIGIQQLRKQKVLILILGNITLGIWAFVASKRDIKINGIVSINYEEEQFINSLFKGYKCSYILSIVSISMLLLFLMCILWFRTLAFIPDFTMIRNVTFTTILSFYAMIILAFIASFFNSVQHFRKNKLAVGFFMMSLGGLTFGI